ncbi:MAG: cytochrome P450 [Leptolyngbyaceae cyanobacterium CSU_1_4]|nr:cytochrome P450 [Leptolyngbyaceae cyanobacterium CSU_1_4]
MQEKRLEFNPFSLEFQADPYPIYQVLRTEDPMHPVKGFKFNQWFLSRYKDVYAVLNDARFKVDDLPERLADKALHLKQKGDFEPLIQTVSHWLFFLEPPDHTRLRSLVQKMFSSLKVESLRPQIEAIVNHLLDRVEGKQMDIMMDLASPLPALVSSELLGIPMGDRVTLTQWAYTLFHVFDQPLSLQDYQHINQVALNFKEYFGQLIADFRKNPQDNLVSKLIQLCDQEGKLSEAELLGFLSMLFSVGQETTENLIGNGIFALLNHPDALESLQQNPHLMGNALEELLRYDSPVQIISRTAIEPVEMNGKTIQKGDKVNLLLGAANRDPEQFSDPDRLSWHRHESSRLPFGSGIHYCLGAELARMQGQVALSRLIQRFPRLQLNLEKIERRKNIVLRGFKVLPVIFS